MTTITVAGSAFTSQLAAIMAADEIEPGSQASYQLCKLLWTGHPLGGKLVESPITMAQSEDREISVPGVAEQELVEAFEKEWDALDCTAKARDTMHISRAYGVGAIIYGFPGLPTDKPLPDLFELATRPGLYFNIYDPLNLSGSVITNQNPNAVDFQKPSESITAGGQPYHGSRTCVVFHGTPVYLDFQASSFSFSGRSVFLRVLYSMKSYLQTMQVADMVSRKAGLLIAKTKQNSSIIDGIMERIGAFKRSLLKEAVTDQVLQVDVDDVIESLNLQNTDKAMTTARDTIIADIAAGSDVPAIVIKDEAFAKGFANGDQDMMRVVQFINSVRQQMDGVYDYLSRIVRYRAWTPELFEVLKTKYPEVMKDRDYKAWFFECCDRFEAKWPSLIQESQGEATERNAKKLKAVSDLFKVLATGLDPENGARLRQWIVDSVNSMPELFTSVMEFDPEAFANYTPPMPAIGGAPGDGGDEGGDGGD